ncbi:fatty acyl-AMP ligase [Streptomyces sp. PKU-EA00015]|uniref:fatty acyl-AMP ligase n=1 Tax=Streptomyces sp. PKU-EA00015 TaxID=2748326 RepID=UPI0015A29873|nr:fatty acyl-AMP ligase [Streptomyces sp. PKU-EA00015]NWF31347.1 fatty acyl-AMP ligase [Streptomyces sp. PKU-EA00015]
MNTPTEASATRPPAPAHTGRAARTIVEALLARTTGPDADRPVVTALDASGARIESLTPVELDRRARALAAALRETGSAGDRVIVPALPGLDFHIGFLGCLYAGMIAVPVPAFRTAARAGTTTRAERLSAICGDCDPCAVLVSTQQEADEADVDLLPGVRWVAVRRPDAPESAGAALPDPVALDPATTALLQYTSGSTGDPRGVVVGHGNLVANQAGMRDRCEVEPTTTIVSWLPFFHDMGLCTAVVLPLVSGAATVTMEPATFVRDPRVWLRAIAAEDDVFTAAPDFAYDMCVNRVPEDERAAIDLSTWRVAVNGSEPVRAATQRRFAEAFRVSFFREEVFSPGFGLAECTLAVSLSPSLVPTVVGLYDRDALAEGKAVRTTVDAEGVELVGCGPVVDDVRVAVVDPETRHPLADRVVGEIWVDSPGNCAGYWGREQESEDVFAARVEGAEHDTGRTYVRTGDLGFVDGGELFITGRIKDVLIIGGENYFPQDAEAVALDSHPAFAQQRAAAWPLGEDDRGVAVVVETTVRDPGELAAAVRAAGIAVAKVLPAAVSVYAVPRNKVPRTTSGKIRRRACAQQVKSGQLKPLAQWSSRRMNGAA